MKVLSSRNLGEEDDEESKITVESKPCVTACLDFDFRAELRSTSPDLVVV